MDLRERATAYLKYKIGTNMYCIVRMRNYSRELDTTTAVPNVYNDYSFDPVITQWIGTGQMYNSADDFVLVEYAPGIRDINNEYSYDQVNVGGDTFNVIEYNSSEIEQVTSSAGSRWKPNWSRIGSSNIALAYDYSHWSEYFHEQYFYYFNRTYDFDYRIDRINLVIPSGIRNIAHKMFESWILKGVELPEGLESIGNYAFQNSFTFTENVTITIPSTLNKIGARAFEGCVGLKNIDFSNNSIIKVRSSGDPYEHLDISCFSISDYPSTDNIIGAYNNSGATYQKTQNNNYYDCYFVFRNNSYFLYKIPLHTYIILGDESIKQSDCFGNREIEYVDHFPPTHTNEYRCYDSNNGEQIFRLYESPQGNYNRVFQVTVNGQAKNLYLPMVDMNDTVNGGNRVQYIEGVGSKRFKK